jgi:hypothetical protein
MVHLQVTRFVLASTMTLKQRLFIGFKRLLDIIQRKLPNKNMQKCLICSNKNMTLRILVMTLKTVKML